MARLLVPAAMFPTLLVLLLLTVLGRLATEEDDGEGEVEEGWEAPCSGASGVLLSWVVKHGPYRFLQLPLFFFFTPSSVVEEDDVADEDEEDGWGRLYPAEARPPSSGPGCEFS